MNNKMAKKKKSNKNLKIILFSLGGIILFALMLFFILNTNDNDPCKEYKSLGYTEDNDCYLLLAMDEDDISYCKKIKNITRQNACITFYSAKKEDFNYCSLIEDDYPSAICYNFHANKINDSNICYEISNKQYKDYCLENLKTSIDTENTIDIEDKIIQEEFDLNEYRDYLNSDNDKIDCSKTSNYNKEKLDLAFDYNCYFEEDSTQFYYGECDGIQGVDKLDANVDRYPSLNENYFNSVDLTLKNIGCTKIKSENYNIKYQLIQNNQILAEIEHTLDYSLRTFNTQDTNYVYPEEYGFLYLGFRDSVPFSDNSDLYFKVCIYNKNDFSQAVCNQVKV